MKARALFGFAALAAAACAASAPSGLDRARAQEGAPARLDVARFDADGNLIPPADLDMWVHVGSALGMSYNEALPPTGNGHPPFTVVTMEPTAYRAFMATGQFAEGTMFHLQPYSAMEDGTFEEAEGLATDTLLGGEIHLQDSERFPSHGFGFYFLDVEGGAATPAIAEPNACVTCHVDHAAFDGAFTQYYPKLRERLASAAD